MKINKEFAHKMGYNENKANFILAIAKARGKGTQTIICPTNKDFKPFLIINNYRDWETRKIKIQRRKT